MSPKPKTFVYIFYSLLAAVLLTLIVFNTLFFAAELRDSSGWQIAEPAGTGLVV